MEELQRNFGKVVDIIESAKNNAYRKVNEELIKMYWKIGQFLSEASGGAVYGDFFMDELAGYI